MNIFCFHVQAVQKVLGSRYCRTTFILLPRSENFFEHPSCTQTMEMYKPSANSTFYNPSYSFVGFVNSSIVDPNCFQSICRARLRQMSVTPEQNVCLVVSLCPFRVVVHGNVRWLCVYTTGQSGMRTARPAPRTNKRWI